MLLQMYKDRIAYAKDRRDNAKDVADAIYWDSRLQDYRIMYIRFALLSEGIDPAQLELLQPALVA